MNGNSIHGWKDWTKLLTKALNRGKRGVDKAQALIGLWTYLIE